MNSHIRALARTALVAYAIITGGAGAALALPPDPDLGAWNEAQLKPPATEAQKAAHAREINARMEWNCYNYAVNQKTRVGVNEPARAHPGKGQAWPNLLEYITAADMGEKSRQRAVADGLRKLPWNPGDPIPTPPAGENLVALGAKSGFKGWEVLPADYHWMRKNGDGTWSQKCGSDTARATYTDRSTNPPTQKPLTDPRQAEQWNGYTLIGFMSVPKSAPPNIGPLAAAPACRPQEGVVYASVIASSGFPDPQRVLTSAEASQLATHLPTFSQSNEVPPPSWPNLPAGQYAGIQVYAGEDGQGSVPPYLHVREGVVEVFHAWPDTRAEVYYNDDHGLEAFLVTTVVNQETGACYTTTGCAQLTPCQCADEALGEFAGPGTPCEVQPISVDIAEWINDAFPANENPALPGLAAFDTTTALIKTGRNSAQLTGDMTRYDVPSDSTLIQAVGDSVEVQLVFRILPGPGNYSVMGDRSSGLRKVATNPAAITSTDNTFWTLYTLDNGKVPDGHPAGPHPTRWSELVWNSARCDTAQQHTMFPVAARNVNSIVDGGIFSSTYHENDPKYNILGLSRHKCFMNDTLGGVNDLTCNTVPAWVTTVPQARTGYDSNATTVEGTKILPDGLLTPGSHVQYFFVRKDLNTGVSHTCPDTNTVSPQNGEGPSFDGHRWQQFGILPDRWKAPAYGGIGMACLLFVDFSDRRGSERIWASICDSIAATQSAKYGAHNGWHAAGGASVNDPAGFVHGKNQQPGTTWDMYGVKGAELPTTRSGSLGSRLAYRGTPSLLDNQWAKNAPTVAMLTQYYRTVLMTMCGDAANDKTKTLGPSNDNSSDDEGMIEQFLLSGSPSAHKGIWVMGDRFVESLDQDMTGTDKVLRLLQVRLRAASYTNLSGNSSPCIDLLTTPTITTTGETYGVRNISPSGNDVLDLNGPNASAATYYSPVGANPALAPYISGVFKDAAGPNYWQALTDGWDIASLGSRFCAGSYGRLSYFYNVFTHVFAKICAISGAPPVAVESPQNPEGKPFVDLASIGNNPLRQGEASVNLTLAKTDRVTVKIYDVSGRLIRTLADGQLFKAGPQKLTWDGLDDAGHAVTRGVYFARVTYRESGFLAAKKLVFLR